MNKVSRYIKHCYQRITKGYSYQDVWSIDLWFLKIMPKMLRDLAKTTHGCPCDLDFKKWKSELRKMAWHFEQAHNPLFKNKLQYSKETHNEWFERELEIEKYKKAQFDSGMKMFSKYFADLWD